MPEVLPSLFGNMACTKPQRWEYNFYRKEKWKKAFLAQRTQAFFSLRDLLMTFPYPEMKDSW